MAGPVQAILVDDHARRRNGLYPAAELPSRQLIEPNVPRLDELSVLIDVVRLELARTGRDGTGSFSFHRLTLEYCPRGFISLRESSNSSQLKTAGPSRTAGGPSPLQSLACSLVLYRPDNHTLRGGPDARTLA